ncbi:MAG: iron-sulfur cluster assembly scaffold protein [Bryobacterales bacterium]|nr:iron-sulfur cluster assembly scaffold protein [Bryobacterales bacterium]
MHNPTLMDHFKNPRNAGEVEHPTARVMFENAACGDIMLLTVRMEEGKVVEARYKTRGCVASIACGSAFTELLIGRDKARLAEVTAADVEAAVGGLIKESKHAAVLCIDTLKKLLKSLH